MTRTCASLRARFAQVAAGITLVLVVALLGAPVSTSETGDSEIILLDERTISPRPEALPVVAPSRAIENSELRIQAMWFARQAYLEHNQLERAAEQLRAMQEFRHQEGITHLDTIAGAFSYEGYRSLEQDKFGAAHAAFRLAKEFDPDLPHTYYGQARSLRGLRMGWVAALRETQEGMKVVLHNFTSRHLFLGNLLLLGFFAGTLALAALLAILAWKYQPLLRHDLCEALGRRLSEPAAVLLSWLIFLLPLIAGMGWIWVLLFWAVAIFPYVRWGERALITLAMLWTIAATPVLEGVANLFQTSVNPQVRNLASVMRGGYDPEKIRFLKESIDKDPDNATTHFLLGSLYKNGGYLNEALLHYNRATNLDPQLYQALNNLGNLYYLTQNFALAQQQYQRVVDLKPDFAPAYFNLHLAQYQQFHVDDAEFSLETARRLDLEGLGAMRTSDLPTSVLDARLDLDDVWKSVAPGKQASASGLRSASAWTTPHSALAAAMLVFAYVWYGQRRKRRARRCYKCGKPFCSRCRSGDQFRDFCSQCVHLFAKRDGLAPNTKKAKLEEVRRFWTNRRRVSRLFSALAPGLGHVWGDRAAIGFLGLLAWCFCLLSLLAYDRLLRFPELAYAAAWSPAGLLCAVGACVVWLSLNLIPPLRRS